MKHLVHVRCYLCGQRLPVADDYGDYHVFVRRNGQLVRKSEEQWFDPDWVLNHHVRKH